MSFADKLSSLRIILIPVFVSLLMYSRSIPGLRWVALGVFILAVLTDFFDGLVARLKKEKSELGQIIDPLADKLLSFTAFISLYLLRDTLPLKFKMPLGIVLVIVSRDLVIAIGLGVLHLLKLKVIIAPSIWGKLTTLFQMFTILGLLCNIFFFPWIWKVAAIFTLISGVDYFLRGAKVINAKVNSSGS
jgi:cardiolipin synthase